MSRIVTKGAVDQTIYLEVLDSTSTTGGRKTGLVFNTASLTAYYVRNQGSATAITLATLAAANSAHSDGGFKEVDATNMPGVYRLDLPDAAVASGADSVVVTLKGATGMAQVSAEIQLVAVNPQDSVRGGMTTLPDAAADAAGGLPISDAGGLDLDARLDAAITSRLAPTVAGRTLDVSVGGEAGVDWANVGSPTTTVGLSGTTIKTAADVETDTSNIQSRLPDALTAGGNMKSDALAINGDATSAANLAKTTKVIGRGTASGVPTTTSIPTSAFSPSGTDANQFVGRIITFDADTATAALRGQSTDITANSAAANPTFTVTVLTTNPASGDTFSVT